LPAIDATRTDVCSFIGLEAIFGSHKKINAWRVSGGSRASIRTAKTGNELTELLDTGLAIA
jgi:hypothetical protein